MSAPVAMWGFTTVGPRGEPEFVDAVAPYPKHGRGSPLVAGLRGILMRRWAEMPEAVVDRVAEDCGLVIMDAAWSHGLTDGRLQADLVRHVVFGDPVGSAWVLQALSRPTIQVIRHGLPGEEIDPAMIHPLLLTVRDLPETCRGDAETVTRWQHGGGIMGRLTRHLQAVRWAPDGRAQAMAEAVAAADAGAG